MKLITVCLAILVVFGLVMLASASSNLGKAKFDDALYYLKHQILFGLIPGLVGFFLARSIPRDWYQRLAVPLLLLNIIFLILVFTPIGFQTHGAERWVEIGPITFQPSELLKISFVLYLAAWLGGSVARQNNFLSGFLPFIIVLTIIAGLLLKQPATSTVAILVAAALAIYFVSGARLRYVLGIIVFGLSALIIVTYFTPYRLERFKNFLSPEADARGGNYQLNQALIAIGSGGLLGVGYGESTTKIHYLPEPVGDSIFAVIAEELGFAGVVILIAVFVVLVMKIFMIAGRLKNKFSKLALAGFGTIIGLQTFTHIASISGLIPLTGIPLPFISYGGTALAVFMTMGGMIANLSLF